MAKIKYKVVENDRMGTHSFYAVPVPNGTLTFEEMCNEACDGRSIEPSIMMACVREYMKAAQRNLLKGFRVPVGEEFLFIYPNLKASAKDEKNLDGSIKKVATADMVSVSNKKTRLGCSVSPKYSDAFASAVSWQRVDPVTGSVVEDSDDITEPTTPTDGNSGNGGNGGGNDQGGDGMS